MVLSFCSASTSQQLAVAVTSPGLFKEWVTTETPGRLPLGPAVLLGQLSGRPVVLVYVCAHLCFKGQRWQTSFNIFSALSKWRFYCLVWFTGMFGYIQKVERSNRCFLSVFLKFWLCLPINPKLLAYRWELVGWSLNGLLLFKQLGFVWHSVALIFSVISCSLYSCIYAITILNSF